MKYLSLIACIVGILLMAMVARSAEQTVKLGWCATPDEDVVGYHVYQAEAMEGPWARINTDTIVELEYALTITDPVEADLFWFCTATDGRNESGPSNIVFLNIDTIPPGVPSTLHIVDGAMSLMVHGTLIVGD